MKASPAPRRKAFDTVSYVTEYADDMKDAGYPTVIRYLNYGPHYRDTPCTDPNDWFKSLSRQELDGWLVAEFYVGLVQRGIGRRNRGGAVAGEQVGKNAAHNAHGLGIPHGCTIFCDCEWSSDLGVGLLDQIEYINAWAYVVAAEGYMPGQYVSPDLLLTSSQLYEDLRHTVAYWKSASYVPTVNERGFVAVQTLEQWYDARTKSHSAWSKSYYGRPGIRYDANIICADGFAAVPGRHGRLMAVAR
jgi:hypothetical protein